MTAKTFVLKSEFIGYPKESDFEIIEEELPSLKDGEYLTEAAYISVDPYMRSFKQAIGNVALGQQVARIIDSKTEDYPIGKYVLGTFGWRSHTIAIPNAPKYAGFQEGVINDFHGLPMSLALGILGMPGNSAYFGLRDVCKPKAGETVVVSGAAGAVGSVVGQIAKILGCRAIGIVGSDIKGKYITEELNFDHYINYKSPNIGKRLKECAPNGIDCYFDNVGGFISSIVLGQMNPYGRICVCGYSSLYNLQSNETCLLSPIQSLFISKQLRMEGFSVFNYLQQWDEGINQNLEWIMQGKLKYKEAVTEGFENIFNAFLAMLQGDYIGKVIVKV